MIDLDRQIQAAQERLELLLQRSSNQPALESELQKEAIAELSIALEELSVVAEELQEKNTELLATHQLLESERQRYQDLFELAPGGYLVTNAQGIIQEANSAIATLLNVPPKYLVGKPLELFVAIADKPHFIGQWQAANCQACQAQTNAIANWEAKLQPRDGNVFPAALSVTSICDDRDRLTSQRWLIQDLSEQKQAEQKICEQAALLDIAKDAIFVQDLENRIIFWNRGAEELYGWTAAEIQGQDSHELLYRESFPEWEDIQQILVEKDEWRGELTQRGKTGQELIIASRWTLVRDEEDNPHSVLIVNTDITEQKKLTAQLICAQRLHSFAGMSSSITHDLKNILTPISAGAQLLKLKLPDLDPPTQEILNIIELYTKRGSDLLQQLLSFSRGLQGTRGVLSVKSLLEETEQMVRATFPKSIAISTHAEEPLEPICGDVSQLHQVLMNLCLNARDAMSDGGALTLSAQNVVLSENDARRHLDARAGAYVVIAVADTGVGISQQKRERIFEPFFTTKEVGKGTGLGLVVVASILKNHGGFVECQSEVGKGSQFEVFLPVAKAEEKLATSSAIPSKLMRGKGELILMVDDETTICFLTQQVLENYGYRVLIAHNGVEAIAMYTQHQTQICAVLMDLMMPLMDGIAVNTQLKKINPQVKVIAVSVSLAQTRNDEEVSANFKAYLSKPYSSQDLLTAIHRVLCAN